LFALSTALSPAYVEQSNHTSSLLNIAHQHVKKVIEIGHHILGTDLNIKQIGKKMHALCHPLATVAETLPFLRTKIQG